MRNTININKKAYVKNNTLFVANSGAFKAYPTLPNKKVLRPEILDVVNNGECIEVAFKGHEGWNEVASTEEYINWACDDLGVSEEALDYTDRYDTQAHISAFVKDTFNYSSLLNVVS